mgnify:FL=1
MFNPINDTIELLRRTYIPLIGRVVSLYNEYNGTSYYVESTTNGEQFVGRADLSEESFEEILASMGFERNPLSSLKRLASTNELEEGSFRWTPEEPTNLNTDYQLHCVIYDGSAVPDANTGETYIYAHWELRWDKRPIDHYNGVGIDFTTGKNMMQEMLDEAGVEYDNSPPPNISE